jgi:hypothetical protein
MTTNQKVVAWVSIVAAGLTASFGAAITFFKDQTVLITAIGGVVSAVVALILTVFKKEE